MGAIVFAFVLAYSDGEGAMFSLIWIFFRLTAGECFLRRSKGI